MVVDLERGYVDIDHFVMKINEINERGLVDITLKDAKISFAYFESGQYFFYV